jgi:hypothetical protein
MGNWQIGKMAKWETGETGNGKLAKWEPGEMGKCRNGKWEDTVKMRALCVLPRFALLWAHY